MSRMNLGPKS